MRKPKVFWLALRIWEAAVADCPLTSCCLCLKHGYTFLFAFAQSAFLVVFMADGGKMKGPCMLWRKEPSMRWCCLEGLESVFHLFVFAQCYWEMQCVFWKWTSLWFSILQRTCLIWIHLRGWFVFSTTDELWSFPSVPVLSITGNVQRSFVEQWVELVLAHPPPNTTLWKSIPGKGCIRTQKDIGCWKGKGQIWH